MKRRCIRCKAKYVEAASSGFRTCPACRVPLGDDGGGCHWWEHVDPDPRVTHHHETPLADRSYVALRKKKP